jgi:hypothetical protein
MEEILQICALHLTFDMAQIRRSPVAHQAGLEKGTLRHRQKLVHSQMEQWKDNFCNIYFWYEQSNAHGLITFGGNPFLD